MTLHKVYCILYYYDRHCNKYYQSSEFNPGLSETMSSKRHKIIMLAAERVKGMVIRVSFNHSAIYYD